ncbi:MAG TPA: hypothetical protein VK841_18295 [Polyangiaceae bacterium]|jgi:hypothetical protein|nr:hypothetical protein [Polyangiaceae bacterium]
MINFYRGTVAWPTLARAARVSLAALAVACGTGHSGETGSSGLASAGSSASGSGGSGASSGASGPSGASSAASGTSGTGAVALPDGGAIALPPPDAGSTPFDAVQANSYVRKVKNVLTGLAPTDAEVAAATDSAALAALIDGWMASPQFEPKMLKFFRNVFQQSQFSVADWEFQLRMRPGAFDLPYAEYGDQAFPLMFQNLQEGIARTAFNYVETGQPFTNILTTDTFMMTTGLMSLYLQVEMPYDIHTFNWQFNQGARPDIADTLNPSSPNYMVWGYAAPTTVSFPEVTQQKDGVKCEGSSTVSTFPGNTNLYNVLLGVVPRDTDGTTITCFEHAIQPYFTPQDQSDWRLVTLRPLNAGETELLAYDLPSIRNVPAGGSLGLQAQRTGFFSSPAFQAVWNTSASNSHRVTANQALLAALGEGFTSLQVSLPPIPATSNGTDAVHSVSGSVCATCHTYLDPMTVFWNTLYSDNDVPTASVFPAKAMPGGFSFANVNSTGTSLAQFGAFLGQVTDIDPSGQINLNRFAFNIADQLCFFANSAPCGEDDELFRQIVLDFQNANYDFKTLVRELLSSPLVTASANTQTFVDNGGVTISISRREQFCDALSNRLGIADLCNIDMPTPDGTDVHNTAQNVTRLAGSISVDEFSRGSQIPVTPTPPNLFFRGAVELVCENLATRLVDATGGPYASTSQATITSAIQNMVSTVMGYPPSDPNYAAAVSILQQHYAAATAPATTTLGAPFPVAPATTAPSGGGATPTNALRSTFVAACESPTSVSIGL